MNIYYITFLFQGKFEFVKFDSNMFTNHFIESLGGDAVWEMAESKGQMFISDIYRDGRHYTVTFAYCNNPTLLNVYEVIDNDDETLVEKNIPYMILKITNGEEELFNISNVI